MQQRKTNNMRIAIVGAGVAGSVSSMYDFKDEP